MTSTILIDASTAPTPPLPQSVRAPLPGPGQTFGGVLRGERIKFTSLRSIRLTLFITAAFGLALSALVALLWSAEMGGAPGGVDALGAEALQGYLLLVATLAAPFLALVFGVLGVFAISSEYSSGMIQSTLTAVPSRTPVYLAKALVLALVAGVTALVLVFGGLGIAAVVMPAAAAYIGSSVVISGALGTVAYLVLIALFAFGIAALLRSTAGGIAVVAGITFVLPVVFQILTMMNWEWVNVVSSYLPMPLGLVLSQGVIDGGGSPDFWQALIAMVVWAAAVLVPAAILFKRRDAH